MRLWASSLLIIVIIALLSARTHGMVSTGKKSAVMKPADKAMDIFNSKFAFSDKDSNDRSRKLSDITETKARAMYKEIAKNYGDEQALKMIEIQPLALAFEKDWIAPSLDAYSDIFGEENAKDMVLRNPGLLAVRPADAKLTTDSTMYFSYAVAATRPLGPLLLPLILLFSFSLAFEFNTGVPLRSVIADTVLGTN